MQKQGIKGVEFICANTDAQVLQKFQNCKIFQLGEERARGLGAGANPEKGREAAEIAEKRKDVNMLSQLQNLVNYTSDLGLSIGQIKDRLQSSGR